MLTYFEERRRWGRGPFSGDLYKVRTWAFLGIPVFRRWEQLTVSADKVVRSELT